MQNRATLRGGEDEIEVTYTWRDARAAASYMSEQYYQISSIAQMTADAIYHDAGAVLNNTY